jgi:tetratricopeptide (TPR) repeat protein
LDVDAAHPGGATTPGGHRLIRAAWSAAAVLLVVGAGVAAFRGVRAAILVVAFALALFVVGYISYLVRHFRFLRDVQRAEDALRRGEHERARTILAPLLEMYGHVAVVQRAAGRALYELGDPLSAAALLERAARSFGDDAELTATLVASYAALNRGGDARRAAANAPKHADVRLALAWSELVALGGDRAAGAEIATELGERADVRSEPARLAMAHLLAAIASARGGDGSSADAALTRARAERASLPAYERAFLGYLEGVALREMSRPTEASAAWEAAMEEAPGTIGEALARRERANAGTRLAAHSVSSSQPSAEPRSSA